MTIRELFDQPAVHFSCEVLPPKEVDQVEAAQAALPELGALSPA